MTVRLLTDAEITAVSDGSALREAWVTYDRDPTDGAAWVEAACQHEIWKLLYGDVTPFRKTS